MQDRFAQIMKNNIKDAIQDCNLNFLLGSGLSRPFLTTLGNLENLLTTLEAQEEVTKDQYNLVRASLYKVLFDGVISKNIEILEGHPDSKPVLIAYMQFLRDINAILQARENTLLSKEVNIFTTNFDVFLEKALEESNLEYNDGFNGRFQPRFDLSNLKKLHSRKSLYYDNKSEIPTFNLIKLHGTLCWELSNGGKIHFSDTLAPVRAIEEKDVDASHLIQVDDDSEIAALVDEAADRPLTPEIGMFMDAYEKLAIINPTKEKFKQTLLNQTHYELLRMYSNELEKENTLLFVLGFSMADEHIREITIRAANSNPTLIVYITAYDTKARDDIQNQLGKQTVTNNNIVVLSPGDFGEEKDAPPPLDFAEIDRRLFRDLI